MRRKFLYGGSSVRHAGQAALALFAGAAMLGCGSDSDSTGPDPRLRFASSISASPTGCGTVKVLPAGKTAPTDSVSVQAYNVSTTWQVTGTWKAVFVNVLPGKIAATTAADANQTKVSIFVDEKGVTQKCLFAAGDRAYAILSPGGTSPVNADADATATIVVGQ